MAEPNREFLARILPREGWKCAAAKPPDNGPLRHFWTRSTDELASIIEQWDAVGYTTYHACASFNTIEGSRKQNNVHSLQSFWLDIDAGAGKPYPDQILALDALKRFAHAASMPEPLVVFSGQGLHAYWPLEEPINYADWKPRADALKALCREHNFGAGPERTGDAASLLRTPGSHHRKDPQNARLVTLHQWGAISSLDHLPLHNAADASGNPTSAKPAHFSSQDFSGRPRNVVPPSGGSGKTSGEQNIQNNDPSWLGGLEGPPADPDKVADQCRQIGYMREIRGDRMYEPLWHASIGVLAWCNEGREVSHEWSDGDARYNENEVDARVDRVLALSGPTFCSRFEELNPDGCAGCPFAGKLSSPIQLGRGGPRIETTIASAPQVEAETLPVLHEPFIWSVSLAILCRSEGMNGKIIDVLVCQYPVLVHAVNRGEINQQRHSVVLRYWRPHEGWAEAELSMKTLFGAHGGAEVAGLGIVVHDNDLWRRYLRQELDAMIAKEKAKVQFEQFGWKENDQAFLVGSRLYTSGAYTEIAGSPEVMLRARYLRPGGERRKGSLAAWKAAADRFGAPGNEAQMVALLMSFGAPLMRFFGEAEGGMVLSIVGAKTGGGKSTALNAATSVWGDRRGLEMVAIDTRVAKSATLAVACNLPVIFDEARERDPESLRDLVQMFTQGRDKLRGTAEGTLVHNSSQWQTILLCGSNKSLVDTIAAAKGSEAMNARILELTLPTLSKSVVDHSLEKQFNDNTGWAGEVYAQIIVNPANQDVIKKALVACASRLVTTYTLGSEHRFLVRGVSCMFVAANIVNSAGILNISAERMLEWTMKESLALVQAPNAKPEDKPTVPTKNFATGPEPLQLLAEYINENLEAMIILQDAWKHGVKQIPQRWPGRRVLLRHEIGPKKLYVAERELRAWLQDKDMSLREFMKDLESRQVVMGRKPTTLTAGTDFVSAPIPCIVVNTDHPAINGAFMADVATLERQAS